MPDNHKHKLFSKEELFRLIDDKRSLPDDADDFDKEATEGLALVKDRARLEELDQSIDEVLRREAAKSKKRRTIYILSAAASLLLLVGFFFLLRDTMVRQENPGLAENKEISSAQPAIEEGRNAMAVPAEANEAVKPGTEPDSQPVGTNEKAPKAAAGSALPAEKNSGSLNEGYARAYAKTDSYKQNQAPLAENDRENAGPDTKPEPYTAWTSPASAQSMGAGNSIASDEKKVQQEGMLHGEAPVKTAQDALAEERSDLAGSESGPATKTKAKNQEVKPGRETPGMPDGYAYYDRTSGDKREAQKAAEQAPAPGYHAASPVAGNTPERSQPVNAAAPEKEKEESKVYRNQQQDNTRNAKDETVQLAAMQHMSDDDKSGTGMKEAEFPEGSKALKKFVEKNLIVSSAGKSGDVTVEFTIGKDGVIDSSDIKIIKPIKDCNPCSKDVTNLIKRMPRWRPAKDNGIPVESRQKLKVHYDGSRSGK